MKTVAEDLELKASTKSSRATRTEIGTLQVVLKVAERCNINCTYCYYFNGGDEAALSKPSVITEKTLTAISAYLSQGVRDLNIQNLLISFHGGEPLMMKPSLFDYACERIREDVSGSAKVGFLVQTNGTIWNDRYAEVFRKHQINVGISLDGGKAENDRFRLDHSGKSTYDRIATKLEAMRNPHPDGTLDQLSCISVLYSRNDYTKVYSDLRQMGFNAMNFLLPDRSHDDPFPEGDTAQQYGDALVAIAKAYFEEDNESVYVRQIDSVLQFFKKRRASPPVGAVTFADRDYLDYQIMVIHSDGTVALNDSYMPALKWWKSTPKLHVESSTLRNFVDLPVLDDLSRQVKILPNECLECTWRGICGGGEAENRFSNANGFSNPSIYCDGLKGFYSAVADCLLKGGYPADDLMDVLQSAAKSADVISIRAKALNGA